MLADYFAMMPVIDRYLVSPTGFEPALPPKARNAVFREAFQDLLLLTEARFDGSSDLSMVRASSVGAAAVGGKHDSEPIVIKVFESVGQSADLFDDQVDCFGAPVGNP
jgi:hypothetical protein